jgi:hypothetical protein
VIVIKDLVQGSPEWLLEKIGKPSASRISEIITSDGSRSKTRTSYMYELAAEIVTGKREESYKNKNMETGNEREEESRVLFEMVTGKTVEKVGVVYKDENKLFLCSPDGIIDGKEGLELKNVIPSTQVKYLLDGKLPTSYFGQCQMSLFITGFKAWNFCSYVPSMRPLIVPVTPDLTYQEALGIELPLFCSELQQIVAKIR